MRIAEACKASIINYAKVYRTLGRPMNFICSLTCIPFKASVSCPICQGPLAALSDRRFAVCPRDGVVVNRAYEFRRYEHDYFEKEYKNQYGRTYTADRQSILERNLKRYELVKHLVSPATHAQVLEIGSAAGYFLKIMQDHGYSVHGWEISAAMAKYANARGLKTTPQDFLKGARQHLARKRKPYDIVAMFYVLEHLPEQAEVWQHLASLVRPGGYLLLALPSTAGPMFRFHRSGWYASHPSDHKIDYAPDSLRLTGKKFGFSSIATFSEGIHPHRFPLGRFRLFDRLYRKALEAAPLADTIFAVLRREG